jgi:hypothetical protein
MGTACLGAGAAVAGGGEKIGSTEGAGDGDGEGESTTSGAGPGEAAATSSGAFFFFSGDLVDGLAFLGLELQVVCENMTGMSTIIRGG